MPEKRIGIITQARMTSTRLPGKILLDAANVPLLKYHTDRLRISGLPVIVATTTNMEDDPVVAFCEKEGLPFYRGSEYDVLSRFYYAAIENNLDVVVRVTSDCPLIDGGLILEGVQNFLTLGDGRFYLANGVKRTYPRGFDFEVFSFELLKEAFVKGISPAEREHVTPYFYSNPESNVEVIPFVNDIDYSRFRITLDTPEDYELIRLLIERFHCDEMDYKEIINVMCDHPELEKINAHIEQKKL
ncbi:MAG: cytidylyltransferase domain-containing protein [Flavobacteriales bacterium]